MFALPLILAASLATAQEPAKLPNIVVILADDLGYGDLASYGGKIPTPHTDRLAKEGTRFTDAHSGSSVCSPTRYGLLTGRYAWRTEWMKKGVLSGLDPPLIEANRLTVAELLRRAGYTTACIGKWHLGFAWQWTNAANRPPLSEFFTVRNNWDMRHYPKLQGPIAEGPLARGFDQFFGNTAPNQDPFLFIENDQAVGVPKEAPAKGFSRNNKPVALKNEDILPTLVQKASEYIDQRAKDGKRFFLYFPLTSPHAPVSPSAKYAGKSGAGAIGDFLMETDGAVGAVLDALDRGKLTDSTLVIFTSDNGHIATEPALSKLGHKGNGELRATKGTIYEGGHRVPMLVRWPGVTPAGATSKEPLCHTHLIATCAELVGANLPKDAGEDSFSILAVLKGQKVDRPTHPWIVHQSLQGELAIREGPWKWIENGALFNLDQDLAETRDLSQEQPERVQGLRSLLQKVRDQGRSR